MRLIVSVTGVPARGGSRLMLIKVFSLTLYVQSAFSTYVHARIDIDACSKIKDQKAGLACVQSAAGPLSSQRGSASDLPGGWRLVRHPHPRGGTDAVAVTKPADLARSDPDFAGLMLRCADGVIEVLAVLVRPLSPRTRPRVSVSTSGADAIEFEAAVTSPGATIRLPDQAVGLARGSWTAARHVEILIDDGREAIKGTILTAGLRDAIGVLTSICPAGQ